MKLRHLILSATLLLSTLFFINPTLAKSAPKEEVPYVVNFNYTPDFQAAPGSAGVAIVTIGNVTFQSFGMQQWFKAAQFENLGEALKEDLPKLLKAKGFSVRGPFDTYDLIPYPDKKNTDLYLIPTVYISITSRGPAAGGLTKGIVGIIDVKGKMVLELREITTRELMWSKTIDFKEFNFPAEAIGWGEGVTPSNVYDGREKPIGLSGITLINEAAKGIEKQYPEIMSAFSKLIFPEEMIELKKECQELKNKKKN